MGSLAAVWMFPERNGNLVSAPRSIFAKACWKRSTLIDNITYVTKLSYCAPQDENCNDNSNAASKEFYPSQCKHRHPKQDQAVLPSSYIGRSVGSFCVTNR